jgi:hypothetical protein
MKIATLAFAIVSAFSALAASAAAPWVVYEGKDGPGKGKHIVLISGDEEYRSEEALPQMGRILSERHGFKCTVLFAVDPATGEIDPNNQASLPGAEALDSADLVLMAIRFRKWPATQLKHFAAYVNAGKPVIGLRTSTHAFKDIEGEYVWLNDFGKNVLGEGWVSHWGKHKAEATRGVLEPGAEKHPLLRGVSDIFGDTDVYEVYPPADSKILVRGQVLKGMTPDSEPASYVKKRASDKAEQPVNDPMMPIAWTRNVPNAAGKTNAIFCTTMGSATDLQSEGLRRLIVNAAYALTGLEVPAKADVSYVGEYKPTMYGFNTFKKGLKPSDFAK